MNNNDWRSLLPNRILIKITEDRMGKILVSPVYARDRVLVAMSNEYNHDCEVYLQTDYDRYDFLVNYPKARFRINKSGYDDQYHIGRYYYEVNDGAKFYIDSYDFRHMVGGQCD